MANGKADARSARLDDELNNELKHWRWASRSYGVTYYTVRIILIIASAIVAASANLEGSVLSDLVRWVPALALLVAILTAIDTWLKPSQKWSGFLDSRDKLADLILRKDDGEPASTVRAELLELRKEHRKANVF